MIDEKKIEEAAIKFAEKCSGDYIATSNSIEGFKVGINWLLDNLWHDASEEPKEDKEVLIESCTQKGKGTFVRIIPFDWKFSIKHYSITRWLYIDDLLKGGK